MISVKREIDKNIFEEIKNYIKENKPDCPDVNSYYVPSSFKEKLFDPADIYGYGVYSAEVYELDGKYYLSYNRGESCD